MRAPVYLGEFGLIFYCYDENRGGIKWSEDMLDILLKEKISFNYHAYHEELFGIYKTAHNQAIDENKSNKELIVLFKKKLK